MCTEGVRCMQFDRGVFVLMCLYVCVFVCLYVCVFVCLCVCVFVCLYVFVSVFVFDGQDCVQRAQDVCSSIGQLTGVQQRQQGSLVLARFFC